MFQTCRSDRARFFAPVAMNYTISTNNFTTLHNGKRLTKKTKPISNYSISNQSTRHCMTLQSNDKISPFNKHMSITNILQYLMAELK